MAKMSVNIDVNSLTNEELRDLQYEIHSVIHNRLTKATAETKTITVNYKEVLMLQEHNPIKAIKSLRERCNISLKEAKDIIDNVRREMGIEFENSH